MQENISLYPSADEVMDNMVPNYLTGIIYGCLVEAYASEHNARMMAMRSSTDNAKEMPGICPSSITAPDRRLSRRRLRK